MCGFAGYLSSHKFEYENLLNKMGLSIVRRGPDASGIWFDIDNGIGFCHRRLSILDLTEAGAQPMFSLNGRYVMSFNGEIYNFKEIKIDLEKQVGKINWKGHSDTEVILAGFEIWGFEETLKRMTGMFAIALWDKQTKELLLARDRIGEKPLYYGWHGSTFLFGSELKALQQHPDFKKEICQNALAEFFKKGYIYSENSIYAGIKKLKPGTYCKVSLENKEVFHYTYWELNKNKLHNYTNNAVDSINNLEDLLMNAIGNQMIADVPLGAFLSGGVDSSLIVALMQRQSNVPIKTFSIGFNEKGFDEAIYARKVAQHLNTDHTEMYISSAEAAAVIPFLSDIYDEPFADASQIPTYLVSKLAKEKVTVSLSGDAGDELFCGYDRYINVDKFWNNLSKVPYAFRKKLGEFVLRQSVRRLDGIYAGMEFMVPDKYKQLNFSDKLYKVADKMDFINQSDLYDRFTSFWNLNELMNTNSGIYDLESLNGLSFIDKMMYADIKSYLCEDILVKVDRAAMFNSLETRVPFLDHRVVEFAWDLPLNLKIRDGKSKWILKEILYKHVPKTLIERPKTGFVVPLDSWLRGPLKEWAMDLLSSDSLDKHKFLNKAVIHKKLEEHMAGVRNWQYQLWAVLMFQSWFDKM